MGWVLLICCVVLVFMAVAGGGSESHDKWEMGTPIATYFAGPWVDDKVATQMVHAGINLAWCVQYNLDVLKQNGLRALVENLDLLKPATLDDKTKTEALVEWLDAVNQSEATYAYWIQDEPSASDFPGLGSLVDFLRKMDPTRLSYIDLFPDYASGYQLGGNGPALTYQEYLDQFISIVNPDILSFDHYCFRQGAQPSDLIRNLASVRNTAQTAKIPFMTIIQACKYDDSVYLPTAAEMLWQGAIVLAFGGLGISYYVYYNEPIYAAYGDGSGMLVDQNLQPTAIYDAVQAQLPGLIKIATQLSTLDSLVIYYDCLVNEPPAGTDTLPASATFWIDKSTLGSSAFVIGTFGQASIPSAAFFVNQDLSNAVTVTLMSTGDLDIFDPTQNTWTPIGSSKVTETFEPGEGKLVRLHQ